jgi:CBS domain-containing protein
MVGVTEPGPEERRRHPLWPTYVAVDDLLVTGPLVVDPGLPVRDAARLMSERDVHYAAVTTPTGIALITDELLRRRVVVDGLAGDTPAGDLVTGDSPVARLGDSAAEALILMLDRDIDLLPVVDLDGDLRGVIVPRDFVVSTSTAGASLHEQLRRAASLDELDGRALRVPSMLDDLLRRGLAPGRATTVYSALVDTVVRRAIQLVFRRHPELSTDAFTWLALGSNGRRESVPSSDIDSAVSFDDSLTAAEQTGYRAAFAEVNAVLVRAGLTSDEHGATAERAPFARTHTEWKAAAERWVADPAADQGAMMTSLLLDGRPIHGDASLPEVTAAFTEIRRHAVTMRLLLEQTLSTRARPVSAAMQLRAEGYDVKHRLLLPVVNIARWAALTAGSAALPTIDRLLAAAGSQILPDEQAQTLVEVFEVVQRVRLQYQLGQLADGHQPTDLLLKDRMSPIDRSIVAQAVREVAAVQRRMGNIALYVPPEYWVTPDPG